MRIEIAEPGRMTQSGSSLVRLIQNNNMPVLDLLVRESIQNSLDARRIDTKYVNVEFITGSFKSKELADELEGVDTPLNSHFQKEKYDFIAVRDSCTVGLTGELNYKNVKNNDYGNLLKLIYEICKPQDAEGAGGSWGLGKTVYFRIGIGLVIYYSRIKTEAGYASRLAASYVEDETSNDAIIPSYHGQAKRGIAWWGDKIDENLTQPVTDEGYINGFLSIFGIKPYKDDETGTTIIIPYIDRQSLLSNNQIEYLNGNEQSIKLPWCNSIDQYLSVSAQRWYAPRLNNTHYDGAYLRLRINGHGIGLDDMEPVFRVVQSLYNRANHVSVKDILSETDSTIKIEGIKLNKVLDETLSGNLAIAKVSRELLEMTAPQNKPEPYMYFNCEVHDDDFNRPLVCYTRKPGMIVSYENVGPWASSSVTTSKLQYIIAVFVLSSDNHLKDSPSHRSLEEYVRKSEMADHTSWNDWSEGTYNPRIISKMQNGVNRTINREFMTQTANDSHVEISELSKLFGDMLLPPDGFGKKPGPGPGPKPPVTSARKNTVFKIISDDVTYVDNMMTVPFILETSKKDRISKADIEIEIDSETKRISLDEWETEIGMLRPFSIERFIIEVESVDGQKDDYYFDLGVSNNTETYKGILFVIKNTSAGTCKELSIISDESHSVRIMIKAEIRIYKKDVKPAFVLEKEIING